MKERSGRAPLDDPAGGLDVQSPQLVTFDAILPAAMALRAEQTGINRVTTDPLTSFVLSILAGALIAFGAIFATTVMAGSIDVTSADRSWVGYAKLPYGVVRLLAGLVFSLGTLGVLCNALVCLGVWMCYGARSSADRMFCRSPLLWRLASSTASPTSISFPSACS